MPFKLQTFQENVERLVKGATRDQIAQVCQSYTMLTTPQQKARCIQKRDSNQLILQVGC
jgi:hypothetical protein